MHTKVYLPGDCGFYFQMCNCLVIHIHKKTYIDSSKENNEKYPKSKIGYIVRILKYKIVFAKDYTPNW